MISPFLRQSSMCAALLILFVSCRQPIDLDTDRTVVPTNLPEITDIEPKGISLLTTATVTIIGKNFVGVQRVAFDTIIASSFRVESSSRIIATLPRSILPVFFPKDFFNATVITTRGIATSAQLVAFGEALSGRIDGDDVAFDSLFFYATKESLGIRISNAIPRPPIVARVPKGYYYLMSSIFAPASNYSLVNPPLQGSFTLQPFLSGYSFTPIRRSFVASGHATGGLDFTIKKVPAEQIPEITDIKPRSGLSNSGDQSTGSELTLQGKGLARVKNVLIGIRYGNPTKPFESLSIEEASIVRIDNDNQVVFRLPRLDRTQAISGGVYVNCRVFIVTENTSLYAQQRISIQYR